MPGGVVRGFGQEALRSHYGCLLNFLRFPKTFSFRCNGSQRADWALDELQSLWQSVGYVAMGKSSDHKFRCTLKTMKAIEPPDSHHLNSAQGWLGLGNHVEADADFQKLSPEARAHPDALIVQWSIYEKGKQWEKCVEIAFAIIAAVPDCSFGWIHVSCPLYELKRTEQAFEALLPVAEQFADNWGVTYNLAFYSSRLNRPEEARGWLAKALAVGPAMKLRLMALDDPNLKMLLPAV
jgi:tetratricopeptide (TPR) repeat protein